MYLENMKIQEVYKIHRDAKKIIERFENANEPSLIEVETRCLTEIKKKDGYLEIDAVCIDIEYIDDIFVKDDVITILCDGEEFDIHCVEEADWVFNTLSTWVDDAKWASEMGQKEI